MKILFSLGLVFLILLLIGFHNMDNCHNMMVLNAELKEYNITYGENSLVFHNIGGAECYTLGAFMMLVSGLVLGIFLLSALFTLNGLSHKIKKI